MSARIRGEHDARWGRWRPGASRTDTTMPPAPIPVAASDERAATGSARHRGGWRSHRRPVGRWLVALAVAVLAVSVATAWSVTQLASGPAQPRLPATPGAWLDAYEAAAIDNPPRVCTELFAPQLAQTYGAAVHGSCSSYFARITSFSVVIRRVLLDGGTAVLELRQTVHPEAWAVVLSRRDGGWQAVDLLTGNLAR